jgi:hypothetical protein
MREGTTLSAAGQGRSEHELLERFWRDLVDLRERHGNPGAGRMYVRRRHEPNTAGTKDAFARLARGPMTTVPGEELLRGFLLGMGVSPDEAATWELRRQELLREVQRLRRTDAASADASAAVIADTSRPLDELVDGGRPRAEAPDDSRRAHPAPSRRRRRTLQLLVALPLVVGGGAALGAALYGEGDVAKDDLTTVTGRVSCVSGAPVVGVYVDAGDGARGFADFHTEDNPAVATFARSVHRNRPYDVHVGCGGQPARWRTDNRSDALTGTNVFLRCDDAQAVAAGSHYGTCRRD